MIPVTIKAIIDWARAVPGYSGVAIFSADIELYNEAIEQECSALLDLLMASHGSRRASAIVGGFTLVAFHVGDYAILLKAAGRFPDLSPIRLDDPAFVDPSCVPALPSRAEAQQEAEAALRQLGLI